MLRVRLGSVRLRCRAAARIWGQGLTPHPPARPSPQVVAADYHGYEAEKKYESKDSKYASEYGYGELSSLQLRLPTRHCGPIWHPVRATARAPQHSCPPPGTWPLGSPHHPAARLLQARLRRRRRRTP
jgi:hypothetical protein